MELAAWATLSGPFRGDIHWQEPPVQVRLHAMRSRGRTLIRSMVKSPRRYFDTMFERLRTVTYIHVA
eukprot:scaffold647821_cov48-Prasinocladus_malaysianus.AAC.2